MPFWVLLGISTRLGRRLTRREALSQGRMEAILAMGVLVAGMVIYLRAWSESWPLVMLFGFAALGFSAWRWQAIQWLDRRDAWHSAGR